MTEEPYRNYYEAKFAREAKARPTDWFITPDNRLVRIGSGS